MHPLDFAMQMELEGKEFYLKQAGLMEDPLLSEVFQDLAADEEKHYQVLKQIKNSKVYDYVGSTTLKGVLSIFAEPPKIEQDKGFGYIAIYQTAIEFEKKAINLYRELAKAALSELERETFLRLEREEEEHRITLWRILQFLQRPEEWYPYIY